MLNRIRIYFSALTYRLFLFVLPPPSIAFFSKKEKENKKIFSAFYAFIKAFNNCHFIDRKLKQMTVYFQRCKIIIG